MTSAYEISGQTPPVGPMIIPQGEYHTEYDGERFTTTLACPGGDLIIVIDDHIA